MTAARLHKTSSVVDLERGERTSLARVTPRHHRHVDLLGQRVRLAEQGTSGRRHERASGACVAFVSGGTSSASGVHVEHRVQQMEQVAIRHPEHEDEQPGNEQRPKRGQQAGPRSRQREQHDQRDRRGHAGDDHRRARQAFRGDADLVTEPCPERDDDVARSDDVQRGREDHHGGEHRDEQPHPPHEQPERQPGQHREHDRSEICGDQDGQRANEGHGDEKPEQRHDLDPRIETLQQPFVGCGVLGEQRFAHHPRGAVECLGDVVALAPATDASARAETDLALEQPGGRRCRRHARAETRDHVSRRGLVVACPRRSWRDPSVVAAAA